MYYNMPLRTLCELNNCNVHLKKIVYFQCETSMGPVDGCIAKFTKTLPDMETGSWERGIGVMDKLMCLKPVRYMKCFYNRFLGLNCLVVYKFVISSQHTTAKCLDTCVK